VADWPRSIVVVIDCGFNTSAGEQVASWAPGAFVFKTLNTTGAGNMAKAADYRVNNMRRNKRPIAIIRRSCSDSPRPASQMDRVFGSDNLQNRTQK
jgi:hypothetical protein